MTPGLDVTPLVLVFNESANIARTLGRLSWAPRVVVIDSFSTDDTVEICRAYPNVEVIQRRFDDHVSQWNFGLEHVRTPWVLSLDADYVLTDGFLEELKTWQPRSDVDGYAASFAYCVFGRPLRASLYPPRVVLFRREGATFIEDGHTQRLKITGAVGRFASLIQHDDRKSLDRWMGEQQRYAALEARHLAGLSPSQLNAADRVRRQIVWAPMLVSIYLLIGKGLLLDGWAGLHYTFQRVTAECLLSLRLLDARLRGKEHERA